VASTLEHHDIQAGQVTLDRGLHSRIADTELELLPAGTRNPQLAEQFVRLASRT
jgi:hypothetical protein